jgi:hypothetical protein
VDVQSTAGLVIGDSYVILDDDGSTEVVTVAEILSPVRFRCADVLISSRDDTGTLSRTSWDIRPGYALAQDGGILFSRPLHLGGDDVDKALVIRREDSAAEARVYFQDANHPTWTEAPWTWRRPSSIGLPDLGLIDVEYRLPARGALRVMIVIEGAAEPLMIKHILGLARETLLGGLHHAPETPVNSAPSDAAVDVIETPTLTLEAYISAVGSPLAGVRFRISTDAADLTAPLYDSGEQPAGLSHRMPPDVLLVDASYHWQGQVKDDEGTWSEWSAPTEFRTAATFEYIVTPQITSPTNGAVDTPEQPTLFSSAFAVHDGTDTHEASRWQIRSAAGSYTTPDWDSGEDAVNLEEIQVPAGILADGTQTYYARVQHKGTALGWSEWSAEISFTTKDLFANIVGIALVTSGGGGGTWARVDEDGNNKTTDASFFNGHPVYGGITDAVIDSQDMVKIPKFYYRVAAAPTGSDRAGKKCWWISDQPADGFVLHPAFMDGGVEIPYFYVGKYQGSNDSGTKLGSVSGVAPLVSIDFPTMQSRASARNAGGVSGFGLWSIYQLSAIQMLALIETGGADMQSLIGRGRVDTSSAANVDATDVAQATWRGIVGLWGNVWQMVDGLKTNTSNQLQVWDRQGNKTWVPTGVTVSSSGWVVSVLETAGATFDFRDLFVASAVDGTEGNSTFADYFWSTGAGSEYVAYHGGDWDNGSHAGLFILHLHDVASRSSTSIGGRLAKV